MRKFIFFVVWAILLLLVPVTILQTTPLAFALKNHVTLTNLIQRFFGLAAFVLLFVQLILGAFMSRWIEKMGEWIFKFHLFEGVLIYFLVLLHPIFFMIFNHFAGSGWNPYAVFVNVCLLCKTPLDYYYTLGRISFWLLTVVVLASIFRKATPWLRANWRKLHVFNYVVFLLVGLHGFLTGTDFRIQPFYLFAIISYTIVACVVIFIEIPRLYKNFRSWLNA